MQKTYTKSIRKSTKQARTYQSTQSGPPQRRLYAVQGAALHRTHAWRHADECTGCQRYSHALEWCKLKTNATYHEN